jgi:PAS domain-containing protein
LLSGFGVSLLATHHLFLPGFPLESFLIFYAVFGLMVSWFSSSRRRAEQLLTDARDNLELRVAERTGELVRAHEELQNTQADLGNREANLAEAQRLSHTGSFGWKVSTGEIFWSDETYNIFEFDGSAKPTLESVFERMHPDDRDPVQQALDHAIDGKADFDIQHRLQMPDGRVKHLHIVARATNTSSDDFEFVGAVTDVTAVKHAEDMIQQSQTELRNILDFAPHLVAVFGPDRSRLYTNQAVLDYCGFTLEEWRSFDLRKYYHPGDWERLTRETQSKFLRR